jgi:hypothetical protein
LGAGREGFQVRLLILRPSLAWRPGHVVYLSFPCTGMTGDLVKIIASDNGARILPEPQESG